MHLTISYKEYLRVRAFASIAGEVHPCYSRGVAHAKKEYSVIIERDAEGFYLGRVPELRGCHTQAKTLDTLMKRIMEAIELCRDVEGEPASETRFIGVQRIEV